MSDTIIRNGREVPDPMTKVQVFCFRWGGIFGGYFGFGLSPEAALEAARKAGLKAKDAKNGRMIRLPEGVTKYAMTDMGSVQWQGPEGMATEATPYMYDAKARKWVESGTTTQDKKEKQNE